MDCTGYRGYRYKTQIMIIEDIEIGRWYKIKDWSGARNRPRRWNASGMMDKYAGQTVLVTNKRYNKAIRIDQGDDIKYRWAFDASDFEVPVDLLEDELFEI